MHTNIKDLQVGQTASGVYIVNSHAVKPTKVNTSYLDITLSDKTGTINGKMWTIPANFNVDGIVDGYFILVAFAVEEYQGKKQVKIDNIKLVTPDVKFDKSEIIPTAPQTPSVMFGYILDTINDMDNAEIQKLCYNVMVEKKDALMLCPGAKSMHHAELGGLLHHITGMLKLGKAVAETYPEANKDLLLGGIILHDICKLREFELGPIGLCVDYTKQGKLLGHITMGCSYIEAKCKELNISEEITTLIMHMILSHHGEPDFGSAIRPCFLEAFLLNMIDNMDAKVIMIHNSLEGVPVGGFSEKVYGMNNIQLYNHGLK